MRRGNTPSVKYVFKGSSSKTNKKFQKDKKPKAKFENKNGSKHDHNLTVKKKPFKGKCNYCKKLGHKLEDCFKLKKKHEKEGNSLELVPLALVCFEPNVVDVPSNS